MKPLNICCVGLALTIATTVFASEIVFDNLSLPDHGASATVSSSFYWAQSFTTINRDTFFDKVTLDLVNGLGATGNFTVQLCSGGPGNVVATLSGPANPSTGLVVYTPTNTIILNANANYWISAKSSDAGGYYWLDANGTPTIGTSNAGNDEYNVGLSQWDNSQMGTVLLKMRVEVNRPILLSPTGKTNFQFSVTSLIIGKTNLIQVSTNFFSWATISTNVATTTNFNFTDPTPMTNSRIRFYRVWELP
jgi:hypothetical protein